MRGDALVTVETETRRLEIHQDEAIESPRDWDNLGTMAFFHKRYDLGDKDHGVNDADYSSWHEMAIGIEKKFDTAVLMPVYMYDHSGLAFSTDGDTYPFNDRWDAGRIGFMFVTKEKARKEYGKLTAKVIEKIKDVLRSELRVYAQYVGSAWWTRPPMKPWTAVAGSTAATGKPTASPTTSPTRRSSRSWWPYDSGNIGSPDPGKQEPAGRL
jgi:hypothetical protein